MARLQPPGLWHILLAALILPRVSWSADAVPAGYRSVAAERGVPAAVLYAVALTESGKPIERAGEYRPWPWTLNVAGHGYFFDSRLAAWRALMAWLEQGERVIDIGLMQVNWRYHEERLGTPWQALDPYHNLRVGAGILKACYTQRQDWWESVGCYHSPANPERADRYRRRVRSRWQRIASAG